MCGLQPYGCIRGALTHARDATSLPSSLTSFLPRSKPSSPFFCFSFYNLSQCSKASFVFQCINCLHPGDLPSLDAHSSHMFLFWDLCHCSTSRWGISNSPSHCWSTWNKTLRWPRDAQDPAWMELICFMAARMAPWFAFVARTVLVTALSLLNGACTALQDAFSGWEESHLQSKWWNLASPAHLPHLTQM